MALGNDAAKLVIGADVDGALRGLDQVKSSFADVAGRLAVPITLGGIAAFVTSTLSAVAALDDMAARTGASVENLSALQRVAQVGGHDMGVFEQAMLKLNKGLAGTDEESGKVAGALRAIGLSVEDLKGKDPAQSMLAVALALDKFQDGAGKSAIVMDLLGKSGAQALPALQDLAEAGDLQGKVTGEQAAQAEVFEKSLKRLQGRAKDVGKAFAVDMLPALSDIAKELSTVNANGESFAGVFGSGLVEVLKTVTVLGGNVAYVINAIGTEIGGMAAQIAAFLSGDFARAGQIGDMMKEDAARARAEIDAWSERVMKAGQGGPAAAATSKDDSLNSYTTDTKGGGKGAAAKPAQDDFFKQRDAAIMRQFELAMGAANADVAIDKAKADADKIEAARDAIAQRLLDQIEEQNMNMGEREMARHIDNLAALEARNLDTEAEMQRHIAAKIAIDEQYAAQKAQVDQYLLASAGNAAAQFAALLDQSGKKNTALYKLAFLASKGAQIAQMILQTNVAAGMTYSGLTTAAASAAAMMGPAGPAYFAAAQADALRQAGIVKALGYTNAALAGAVAIGQTFGGGGSTGGSGGGAAVMTPTGPATTVQEPPVPVTQTQAAAPASELRVVLMGDLADSLVDIILPSIENRWINGAGNMRLVLERSM